MSVDTMNEEFVISRTFDAPRDIVFRAFSEAERLARWWGPKGFDLTVLKLEFRPGGTFHYRMDSSALTMWGRFTYREIVAPELLTFIVSFSDEHGGVTRHPLSDTWPLETLNTIYFMEHDGQTTLTIRSIPMNATDEERATFKEGHESMKHGFGGTMDQLEDYLAEG